MIDEDERFERAVPASVPSVRRVADFWHREGWNVIVLDPVVRPRGADPSGYGDLHDITIWRKWPRLFAVEVKHRGFPFIDAWPYPTINIDRVKPNYNLADVFCMVNANMSHMAIVNRSTFDQWRIVQRPDTKKGYPPYSLYECPARIARYVPL